MFRNAKRIIFHDILYNYSQDLKDIRNNKYKDNFIYIRELLFVIYIYEYFKTIQKFFIVHSFFHNFLFLLIIFTLVKIINN